MRRSFALCVALGAAALTMSACSSADRGGALSDYSSVGVSCSYTNRVAKLTNTPSSLSYVNFNYASSTSGGAQTEYHTKYGPTDSSVPTWARYVSVFAYDTAGFAQSWLKVPCT